MTGEECGTQLRRLFVLRGLPADLEEYLPALADVPGERFTAAVTHALKTRVWFPTPAELRADCDAVHVPAPAPDPESRIVELVGGGMEIVIVNPINGIELRIPITRLWKFDCDDCGDSGWRSMQCPQEPCGRRYEHTAHEWVDPCQCLEWNPTIRRRKEAGTKYSQAPEKVSA